MLFKWIESFGLKNRLAAWKESHLKLKDVYLEQGWLFRRMEMFAPILTTHN